MAQTQERFNEEKFRKLVALFDSHNINEAENAFRLAHEEPNRNQLTFTDRLFNDAELERAQDECAEAQAKLAELFERYAKREAEAGELEATLDRLHEHIAEMEAQATDASKPSQQEEVHTAPTPYTFFGEHKSDNADEAEALPYRGESVCLPVWITAFWCALLAVLLYYTGASLGMGHPLATLDDWNAIHWYEFVIVALLAAAITYFAHDIINDANGREASRIRTFLVSPRSMLVSVFDLIVTWMLVNCLWAGLKGIALPNSVRVIVVLVVMTLWWFGSGKRHLQNFGVRGVILNALLCLTLLFFCVAGPADGGESLSYIVKSAIIGGLLTFPLCSDWLAAWILDNDWRFRVIAGITGVFALMASIVIYGALNAPASVPIPNASAPQSLRHDPSTRPRHKRGKKQSIQDLDWGVPQ